ncbi:uncharacterized protein C1orf112 homolog isoform X2 [Alligator sinensis]|uniref:Uncharacterized protein C1orf112 homolog isoform X2 n=1 Tax=Alligator sinensis TaxID=38654 RepID=A0A3Q0G386_ALLSI|nr:uncharacterized protein C1orf112 homolog isoform X2 [Alligator sinensis]
MFLPHIDLSELEQTFFSKVLPKAIQLFDDLMYELAKQAKGLTSQNAELRTVLRNILQTLVQLLGTLTSCVRHVCTLAESVPLESIRTLPSSILYVIKNMFVHCKNSESVYNGCLHLISDLLQSLFKDTYCLQKQLMELLDMISMESATTEDSVVNMVSVIHTVLEICSVISNMDHALHANTWKFIIKQSLKHHSLLQSHLKHTDILNSLCKDTLFSFHSSLQLAEQMKLSEVQEDIDHKLFQRTVKLCRFFANSLVHYTKEFIPFLCGSCCQLHQLYLQIYSKFPPSLYAPVISEAHRDEIARVFLVALDPLIYQLLSSRAFLEQVLSEKLDLSPELQLPQCHLLVSIMDKLATQPEEVRTLWSSGSQSAEEIPRLSLFSALFLSFQQCSGELALPVCLPGVLSTGQPEVPVTLYHHVCVHLCAFIAAVLPSHFPQLEYALLDAVLGSSMITSLLAMDSWCFLARYGTAELCAHHVFVIAHLIKSCPSECYQLSILGVLLRRMLFLMAPDHQVEFTQKFPPTELENLPVWQLISLKALAPDIMKHVVNQLCGVGLVQSRQWLSGRRTLGELPHVNIALSALLTVCNSAGGVLEAGQQAAILGIVGQVWAVLQVKQLLTNRVVVYLSEARLSIWEHYCSIKFFLHQLNCLVSRSVLLLMISSDLLKVSSQQCLQQTLCLLLQLLQFFSLTLEPQLMIQVFVLQTSLLQLDPPDHIRLAAVDFLSSLGKLFIPQVVQGQVVSKLSGLFGSLLADRTWLIHQHALEAFAQFAETRQVEETAEARAERMKQENAVCNRYFQKMKMDGDLGSILEPSAKRACHSPSEEQYKSAIGTAEGALEAVKLLLQKGPPPAWLTVKLEALQAALASLRDHVVRN